MAKIRKEAQTVLCPTPPVMVSCADSSGRDNIITLAWAGIVCSEPPMVSISVRPGRFSYPMLRETGQFVVNIPGEEQLAATQICGTKSGKSGDKFAAAGLTREPASIVKVPMIRECPVNLECEVRHLLRLGTHDCFIAEILAVHVEESVLDARGRMDVSRARPFAFMPWTGEYWSFKEALVVPKG